MRRAQRAKLAEGRPLPKPPNPPILDRVPDVKFVRSFAVPNRLHQSEGRDELVIQTSAITRIILYNASPVGIQRNQTASSSPIMSRASKVTLGLVSAITGLIVVAVHNTQVTEREAMHQGVVRDEERQRVKRERALDFQLSAKLREEYESVQPVSNSEDKPTR
ncbi:hypothetical protein H072_2812 [Dactylellina haptotyla CBS 200.50]|uniref:Uncharacterized protein n=1 Tax=Dactylellina haptotyla (strain CBS 200.50) TaxID=1284197 RepID=S8AJV7_DACHA|nr:hypothetical protein H072_2812 [Dactylellina haptotyla CBS 200.50]